MAYSKTLPIMNCTAMKQCLKKSWKNSAFNQSIFSAKIIQNFLCNLWFPVTIGPKVIAIITPWYTPNVFVRMIEGFHATKKTDFFCHILFNKILYMNFTAMKQCLKIYKKAAFNHISVFALKKVFGNSVIPLYDSHTHK